MLSALLLHLFALLSFLTGLGCCCFSKLLVLHDFIRSVCILVYLNPHVCQHSGIASEIDETLVNICSCGFTASILYACQRICPFEDDFSCQRACTYCY